MNALIQQILNDPIGTLLIIGNLILIESLLSVDNAAVLATMVMGLERVERKRALRYGIFGAYLFRGICLVFAAWLIKIWWLKTVGGLYLIYLVVSWKRNKRIKKVHQAQVKDKTGTLQGLVAGAIGPFWATVIAVELMDLAFSMDNVFAAVAFSGNILIILCGVFIGILAMRFVAQAFVKLMEHYPFLEGCAYTVIGLLGIKLVFTMYQHFYPQSAITQALSSHEADWITSALTIGIFVIPVISSWLFNFPVRKRV